jgi:pyocin large subunit-like protein
VPLTNGFIDAILRQDHFKRHGSDFGARDAVRYEEMADTFLGSPLTAETLECTRASNGDIVRYNPTTDEFGVLSSSRTIKTYYKPKPWNKVKFPNNMEYWKEQCKK